MNMKRILALVSCICLLAFGLVGCQPSAEQKAAESTAAFSGTWDINTMTVSDSVTSAEDFQTLKEQGYEVFLIFSNENEVAFYMFGDVENSTWEPIDANTANVDLRGETYEMKLDGDTLTLEGGSTKFEFVKSEEDRNIDDYLLPDAEPKELQINPVTITDDDLCTLTVVSKEVDNSGNVGFNVQIVNKNAERALLIEPEEGTFKVGGAEVKLLGDGTSNPSDQGSAYFYVKAVDIGANTIDALSDLEGSLVVMDAATREVLGNYTYKID